MGAAVNFIILFITLLLEQFLRPFERLREHHRYEAVLRRWGQAATELKAPMQMLLALLPPFILAVLVGLVGWGIYRLIPLLAYVYGVIVLLLCLGPRDLTAQISAYLKARSSGREPEARSVAGLMLGHEPDETEAALGVKLAEVALERVADRLFSVMFWFALMGPIGAVLFRLSDLQWSRAQVDVPDSGYARAAYALKATLAWIPVHLLALTYLIAGGLDENWRAAKVSSSEAGKHFLDPDVGVLAHAGRGILASMTEGDREPSVMLHAAVDLIWRSIVIWMAVIGIITLIGWLA